MCYTNNSAQEGLGVNPFAVALFVCFFVCVCVCVCVHTNVLPLTPILLNSILSFLSLSIFAIVLKYPHPK